MSLLAFDAMIDSLVRQGVPRDKAERTARAQLNIPADPAPEDMRRENVLERTEQLEIVKLFRAFGFEVYWLSQARAAKQTPGLPDLWCMHRERTIAFWWETKRDKGGRFSEAQLRFREIAERCGVGYGSGDRRAARSHIIGLGLARIVGDSLEPIRNTA